MLKKMFGYFSIIIAVIAIGSLSFIKATSGSVSGPVAGVVADQKATCTELGIGWSTGDDAGNSIKDAIAMALEGKKYKNPTFAIIFGCAERDMQGMFGKAKEILGDKTKIYGGVSDYRDIGSTDGKSGIIVITITSPDIKFGVGSADISKSSSVREAAKTAAENAVENAGASQNKGPKLVLLTPGAGQEDQTVKGTKEVVGNANIIVCGTPGKLGVFGEKKAYVNGVSSAVIYTNLPIGYSVIKRAFQNVKKPDAVKDLLVWRCPQLNHV